MSKREIVAIIAALIVGFIAYEMLVPSGTESPDEISPGEISGQSGRVTEDAQGDPMKALVPASRVAEIDAVMRERHRLPQLPADVGLLGVAGNPGEFFFTRRYPGRAEVCVMRTGGVEVLWATETDQILEIVGSHGAELLLKLIDEPFDHPADAWHPGGFYRLDMFAPSDGISPKHLDDETVADMRELIR